MNDFDAIRNLIACYGQTVDAVPRAPQRYANLFIAEGSFTDNGVVITPRSKIRMLMEAALIAEKEQPLLSGTRHLQFNTVINVAGDTASSTSQVIVLTLNDSHGWRIRGSGLYTDEIVRDTDGQWKFKSREVSWFKDMGPDPLSPDLGDLYASFFKTIMTS